MAKAKVVGKMETVSLVALPIKVLPLTARSVVAVKVVVVVKDPGAVMAEGRDKVMAPLTAVVAPLTKIWAAVPAAVVTPVVAVRQLLDHAGMVPPMRQVVSAPMASLVKLPLLFR